MGAAKTVDAYLAAASSDARPKLAQLRKIVRTLAPEAEEGISYGMPFYKWKGSRIGFAAYATHIGFFPGAIVNEFRDELAGYETAKGTVRFPLDERLPVTLIKALIKGAIARNAAKLKKSSPDRRRR